MSEVLGRLPFTGPYLGFFVCGGKLGFREISDQYSYKKQPSKIRHYVRKKTFSFPGGGNCPLRPPAMYGPASTQQHFMAGTKREQQAAIFANRWKTDLAARL